MPRLFCLFFMASFLYGNSVVLVLDGKGSLMDENRYFSKRVANCFEYISDEFFNGKTSYAICDTRRPDMRGESIRLGFTSDIEKITSVVSEISRNIERNSYPLASLCDSSFALNPPKNTHFFLITDNLEESEASKILWRKFSNLAKTNNYRLIILCAMGMEYSDIREAMKLTKETDGALFFIRYRYSLEFFEEKSASFLVEGRSSTFAYDEEIAYNWRYVDLSSVREAGNRSADFSETPFESVDEKIEREFSDILITESPKNNIDYIIKYYFYEKSEKKK